MKLSKATDTFREVFSYYVLSLMTATTLVSYCLYIKDFTMHLVYTNVDNHIITWVNAQLEGLDINVVYKPTSKFGEYISSHGKEPVLVKVNHSHECEESCYYSKKQDCPRPLEDRIESLVKDLVSSALQLRAVCDLL